MPKPASPQFLAALGRTIEDGVSLQRQGKLAEAEKVYTRILKTLPDQFETLHLLANLKMQRGRPGEAFRLATAAVAARPGSADAHIQLGRTLRALKRDADALAAYQKACAVDPHSLEALGHCVELLFALRRPEQARQYAERIVQATLPDAASRAHRGAALTVLGRHAEALVEFDAALAAGRNPIVDYNRGLALAELGREIEAIEAFDRTLAVLPNHAAAWSSRGVSLHALHRHAEAVASFDHALALAPDFARAHLNKSFALLAVGDYRHGLVEYEWRWRGSGTEHLRDDFAKPLWLGETSLQGKTILLHAEQGFGDTIQFARYVPQVAALAAKVVLEVQPELEPLMTHFHDCATVIARGKPRPSFDLHCPVGSLPLAFATELATIPATVPYFTADPARVAHWRARLPADGRRKIGVVWCGNPNFKGDRARSMTFADVAPAVADPDIAFVVLNPAISASDASALTAHRNVINLAAEFRDFSDTAAVIANLDLVITTDTAVAHLAGALGRTAWLLASFSPDWRWLLDREDCPWYPTIRLFRQPALGDWRSVVARVREEIGRVGDGLGSG
jgi:tetratricopeptide (TPR) repeat protein